MYGDWYWDENDRESWRGIMTWLNLIERMRKRGVNYHSAEMGELSFVKCAGKFETAM